LATSAPRLFKKNWAKAHRNEN